MSMGSRENKQNKVRTQLWDTLYLSLPNFDHLENSVGEIKESLADLENILQQNAPQHDFIDNIKCRELSSENKLLKLKITALEKQLYDKNQRIKMLEKLVLETHL